MDLKAEHELHSRRRARNIGVMLLLLGFVGLIFWLTVVKVAQLGEEGMGLRNRMDPPGASVPDPDYRPPQGAGHDG